MRLHESITQQLENFENISSNRKDMGEFRVHLRTMISNWNATQSMLPKEEKGELSSVSAIQTEPSELELAVRRLKKIFVPVHMMKHGLPAPNVTLDQDDTFMTSTTLLGGGVSFDNVSDNKENQVSNTIICERDLFCDSFTPPPTDKVLKEVINSTMYLEINPDLDTSAFKCEDSSQNLDNKKWKSYQTKRFLVITRETQTS